MLIIYDLEYIKNYSLQQDIKIIFLTIYVVLKKCGSDAGKNTIKNESKNCLKNRCKNRCKNRRGFLAKKIIRLTKCLINAELPEYLATSSTWATLFHAIDS